jgi:glycosyltransferase involved in cell wall biosynthesis
MAELPPISIVVIGRNEEKNLEATFTAIHAIEYPKEQIEVIYVDSNSADRSVEIAKQYADSVFTEKHPLPSAARGRNRGLVAARHSIVHFIDGDVQIDPEYIRKAVVVLRNTNIHAVCGFIKEKTDHFWNRIMSGAWIDPQEGFIHATAAGGTYRRQALLQMNGYDERVTLGEETELGERFREAGFKIWSIKDLMGIHDYGAVGFFDYVRLSLKDGKCKTKLTILPDKSNYFNSNRHYARNNIFHVFLMIFFMGMVVYLKKWILFPFFIFLFFALILVKYLVILKVRQRNRLLYYILMNIMKPVVFIGQIQEWIKIKIHPSYKKSLLKAKMTL